MEARVVRFRRAVGLRCWYTYPLLRVVVVLILGLLLLVAIPTILVWEVMRGRDIVPSLDELPEIWDEWVDMLFGRW
jgi:hypothetical protein